MPNNHTSTPYVTPSPSPLPVKSLTKSHISYPDLVVNGVVITDDVEKVEQLRFKKL